jgi:hypothetical protein
MGVSLEGSRVLDDGQGLRGRRVGWGGVGVGVDTSRGLVSDGQASGREQGKRGTDGGERMGNFYGAQSGPSNSAQPTSGCHTTNTSRLELEPQAS